MVTIDKWITLRMTEANAVLIKYLRKELEDVLTDRCVRSRIVYMHDTPVGHNTIISSIRSSIHARTHRFVDPKGREAKDRIIIDTVRRLLVTDKNVTVAL